jgi:pimeloyl-ACP methyl ester carboxylesterase
MAKGRRKRVPEVRLVPLPGERSLGARVWPGDDPPVVLLHGLLDSAVGWDRLARSLSCSCIAFDLPGFGRSDRATQASIPAFAADVIDALDELGVRECTLVGHSLGGAVATVMAEMRPDRVRSLVLLAPAGFGRIHLAEAVSIPGIRNAVAAALPLALSNPLVLTAAYTGVITAGRPPDREMLQRVMRGALNSVPGARDATKAVVAAGRSKRAFHKRGVKYSGPVDVVWGERDHLVPSSHADGVRAALPQARIAVWPGMGHHPQQERAEQLAELVKSACAQKTAGRAPKAATSLRLAG